MLFPPLGHTHKNDLSTLDIYSAQIPPVFQTKVVNALGQFKDPWHNEHSKLVKSQNCDAGMYEISSVSVANWFKKLE